MLAVVLATLFPQFGQPALQPYEVRSASGGWSLAVRPTTREGKGPMRLSIRHGAETSFEGEFPWTFERAAIADDGTCVGYGNEGALRIAVLDEQGALRREHSFEHTSSLMHGPDLPFAFDEVLVHDAADRAWLRVGLDDQSRPNPWRVLALSSAEVLGDVRPEYPLAPGEPNLYEREAAALPGLGLVLQRWQYVDWSRRELAWPTSGAVFSLHDLEGKVVWHLPLLDDYTLRTSEEDQDRLEAELRSVNLIVAIEADGRFSIRHYKAGESVSYQVTRAADGRGFQVGELARVPYRAAEAAPAETKPVEVLTGLRMARHALGSAPRPSPIHGVATLGFTSSGAFELFRREPDGAPSYAQVSPTGELLFERSLAEFLPGEDGFPTFHELEGERWLVQVSEGTPPWFGLDPKKGETFPSPLPDAGLGSHVAPTGDGGYLALLGRIVRMTAFHELDRVAADGTLVWSHEVIGIGPDETPFDRAVYFADGLAPLGEGIFAFLGDELTVFDLERTVLDQWPLEPLLGHEPGYMDGLFADGRGGVFFDEKDEVHRIDAFGARTAAFVPTRADGTPDPKLRFRLRAAPDGRLWSSDGERLYRLDDAGRVDLVLGNEIQVDELRAAWTVAIDGLGRVLVQDSDSRAVHVFDGEGKRLAVCTLEPGERPTDYVHEPVRGHADGSLTLGVNEGRVRFDAHGKRLGVEGKAPLEDAALEALEVRPDGNWLEEVADRVGLDDGRGLVLEDARPGEAWLHLYTKEGRGERTLIVPLAGQGSRLSVSPRWIVIGGYRGPWTLVRRADERVFHLDPGLDDKGSWFFGQSADGKRLLLVNQMRLELVTVELP